MAQPASLPAPPYYAVVFTSVRTAADPEGYGITAERMVELAELQPGFLGIESARGPDGLGITVSYWDSEENIRRWQQQAEHLQAQALGRERWYVSFELRVCRVERAYGFFAAEYRARKPEALARDDVRHRKRRPLFQRLPRPRFAALSQAFQNRPAAHIAATMLE